MISALNLCARLRRALDRSNDRELSDVAGFFQYFLCGRDQRCVARAAVVVAGSLADAFGGATRNQQNTRPNSAKSAETTAGYLRTREGSDLNLF